MRVYFGQRDHPFEPLCPIQNPAHALCALETNIIISGPNLDLSWQDSTLTESLHSCCSSCPLSFISASHFRSSPLHALPPPIAADRRGSTGIWNRGSLKTFLHVNRGWGAGCVEQWRIDRGGVVVSKTGAYCKHQGGALTWLH